MCPFFPCSAPGVASGKLPVVNFAAGGVATPADAALCMQLGVDGVFVGQRHLQVRGPGKACARHCESRASDVADDLEKFAMVKDGELGSQDFGVMQEKIVVWPAKMVG